MNSLASETGNLVSVSWGDHLVFGQGDGKLNTPEEVERRMSAWKQELGASVVLWRELRSASQSHYFSAAGFKRKPLRRPVDWDDFAVVTQCCQQQEIKAYLYVTVFDEGWPLLSKKEREYSYHNDMHARHWSRQSRFTRSHPEYVVCDREGQKRQWGVPCLAYPEVRNHYREHYLKLLDGYSFDGLFLCLRSQSRPAVFADQYGFNEPIVQEYRRRYGVGILKEDFDLPQWRDLMGEYLTLFLSEIRQSLNERNLGFSMGVPRGDIIGPPMGNGTLDWRSWVERDLLDSLVINQSSSQCPSMWHKLWPMHRGYGYIQNYIDGKGMPDLETQLEASYRPVLDKTSAQLYIARQWDERDSGVEKRLTAHPSVSGLVFSSFRYDNPEAIEKGDWRA